MERTGQWVFPAQRQRVDPATGNLQNNLLDFVSFHPRSTLVSVA